MTSTTGKPSSAIAEDYAMLESDSSDAGPNLPLADEEEEEEEEAPPLPPIPNLFKRSVSAADWADMTTVARAVHMNIALRSARNIQRQEAKKSLLRQQEMEDRETSAAISSATTAVAHATQQASFAVVHRNDLLRRLAAVEVEVNDAASAVNTCNAAFAAEEERATALLEKRRRTERCGRPVPRQRLAPPPLLSASREASPSPPEREQAPTFRDAVGSAREEAPSARGAGSVHMPEGGAYVYENDRQEGDSAFLGTFITDFVSYPQRPFTLSGALAVKAAASCLTEVTDENPFATLKDVLHHAVAKPDFPSIAAGGQLLLRALRYAHSNAVGEVDLPRPPSTATSLVDEGGELYDARARAAALTCELNRALSSPRDSDRTNCPPRQVDRRGSARTGDSLRHADRRADRQSRQPSQGKSRQPNRGKPKQGNRSRGGRQQRRKNGANTTTTDEST